ncbi:MAG: ankyrin repeat domain-containing protein, partial [Solirubrobacterales bacterium]
LDVNVKSRSGRTALHDALEAGHEEVAMLLIAKGADIGITASASHGVSSDTTLSLEDAMSRLPKNREGFEKFIRSGGHGGPQNNMGETPLILAARRGLCSVVAEMISRGADVQATDGQDETALLAAASAGHLEAVKLLVAAGADVNVRSKGNDTPLILATALDHQELVDYLVAKGADVNVAGGAYMAPPLYYAAQNGSLSIAETLLTHGAELDRTDRAGRSAAEVAMNSSHRSMVGLLIAKGAKATLPLAVYVGDVEKAASLLDGGADVNLRGEKERTLLHIAVRDGRDDMARLLVSRGADVNAVDAAAWTPLHGAASSGQTELVELLIARGADVNAADQIGWTPLHEAAEKGRLAVVERLVDRGANLNAKTTGDPQRAAKAGYYWRTSYSPLQAAESAGQKEVMRFLIAEGAEVTIRQAVSAGACEVVARLLAEGADVNAQDGGREGTVLHKAAGRGDETMVTFLLSKGADVNAKTPTEIRGPRPRGNRTPLHDAVFQGHQTVAEILLAAGADINAKDLDASGNSPLQMALVRGHTTTAEMLISKGADIHAKNEGGETALHMAASTGYTSFVQMLLDGGAEVNAPDDEGWTPLHKAAFNGHTEVVGLLLAAGADRTLKTKKALSGEDPKTAGDFAREAGFKDIVDLLGEIGGSSPLGSGPYRTIITNQQAVRRFMRYEETGPIDAVWTPQESDLADFELALSEYLNSDVPVRIRTWFDRVYILARLRRYSREYAGFAKDGDRYVICNLYLWHDARSGGSPRNDFTQICDGGCSVVRVVFDVRRKIIVSIDCNGMA